GMAALYWLPRRTPKLTRGLPAGPGGGLPMSWAPRHLAVPCLALSWLAALSVHAQGAGALGLEAGEHAVGFRLLAQVGAARMVTGGFAPQPQPRPLRIYLWYPAQRAAPPLTFGRYAALADDDIWPPEIVGPLRGELA